MLLFVSHQPNAKILRHVILSIGRLEHLVLVSTCPLFSVDYGLYHGDDIICVARGLNLAAYLHCR